MYNPFSENQNADSHIPLIEESLQGNSRSLEELIRRHQGWIYNIAFKMVMDHDDAADITQEILIKIITSLSTYDPAKGAFRTWLYRITVNHILTMKKKKFEIRISDFERYTSLLDKVPDNRSFSHPDSAVLEDELKTGCMMGMLMCLSRRDRLVFLLGAVFNVTDITGAEIMNISRDNFRKILSRSREKVYSYMKGLCGHVNPENRCRCSLKTKTFLEMGMLSTDPPRFSRPENIKIKDIIETRLEKFDESFYTPFIDLFREQPFYDSPDMVTWFRDVMKRDEFHNIFNTH